MRPDMNSREVTISIIIVNYNGRKWLKKCLDSLLSQSHKNIQIIVVDNCSSDGSTEYLKKEYGTVKIIESSKNVGFAGGNNLGISEASGEYILMLNNDAWLESDFIDKSISYIRSSEYDVVGFLEADYDDPRNKRPRYISKIDPFGYTKSIETDSKDDTFNLCGFCLLFKRSLYFETGGLDDNFFMYIEEIDWCWRMRLMGKNLIIFNELAVPHAGSGTVGKGIRYNTFLWRNQNIPQMLIKNYSVANLIWVLPIYIIQNFFEAIFFLAIIRPDIAWSYLAGWGFVIKNIGTILRKRREVQRKRICSDWEIMRKYYFWGSAKFSHLLYRFK